MQIVPQKNVLYVELSYFSFYLFDKIKKKYNNIKLIVIYLFIYVFESRILWKLVANPSST